MNPLRIALVLALVIAGCARSDAPKSAPPPQQLPATTAAAEAPPPPPAVSVGAVASGPQGSASNAAYPARDEGKADKKERAVDKDSVTRAPAPTATATVQKPKCNCTPGDPTCNC